MKIHHNTAKKAKAHKIDLTIEDGEIVASYKGRRLASGMSGTVVLDKAIKTLKLADIVADIGNAEIKAASNAIDDTDGGNPGDLAKAGPAAIAKHAKKVAKLLKQPKAPKAKKTPKSSGPHEDAARAEGWTKVKGGGFKQAGVDDEDGGESDAANWRDLCDEQDIEVEPEGNSIVKAKYRALYRPNRNTNGDDLAQQLRAYLVFDDEGEERIDAEKLARFAKANDCWVESYASLKNVGMRRMNISNRMRAKLRKDPEYAIKWVK